MLSCGSTSASGFFRAWPLQRSRSAGSSCSTSSRIFEFRTPSGWFLVVALPVSIWLNGRALLGPVMGNDDVTFWFVSQTHISAHRLRLCYLPALCRDGKDRPAPARHIRRHGHRLHRLWLALRGVADARLSLNRFRLRWKRPRWSTTSDGSASSCRSSCRWRHLALIATSMIVLAFVWNEFLFALLLTTGDWQTLPILLAGQNSSRGDEWWAISVARAHLHCSDGGGVSTILGRMMRSGLLSGSINDLHKGGNHEETTTDGCPAAPGWHGGSPIARPTIRVWTLNVSTQNGPAIALGSVGRRRGLGKKTCGEVNVIEFPFGELLSKILTAMSQGHRRLRRDRFCSGLGLPDFAPFMSSMPAALQEGSNWEDIHPTLS